MKLFHCMWPCLTLKDSRLSRLEKYEARLRCGSVNIGLMVSCEVATNVGAGCWCKMLVQEKIRRVEHNILGTFDPHEHVNDTIL